MANKAKQQTRAAAPVAAATAAPVVQQAQATAAPVPSMAAQLTAAIAAAPVVAAPAPVVAAPAPVVPKVKVLGAKVIGVAGAVGLPVAGNMVCNVAKLQKSMAGYATKGRTSIENLGALLLTLNGHPWQAVAAALATAYPAGSNLQCYTNGGQAVGTQVAYWQKTNCLATK